MLKQQTRPRALQQSIAIFLSQITFYFISTRNQLPSIVREGTEAGATVMEQGVNLLANRAFSLTWPASMLIYWNKRKFLHKKRIQFPQDCLGTPTWPPFHCFGTPIWPPWRHVTTLYMVMQNFWKANRMRYGQCENGKLSCNALLKARHCQLGTR